MIFVLLVLWNSRPKIISQFAVMMGLGLLATWFFARRGVVSTGGFYVWPDDLIEIFSHIQKLGGIAVLFRIHQTTSLFELVDLSFLAVSLAIFIREHFLLGAKRLGVALAAIFFCLAHWLVEMQRPIFVGIPGGQKLSFVPLRFLGNWKEAFEGTALLVAFSLLAVITIRSLQGKRPEEDRGQDDTE